MRSRQTGLIAALLMAVTLLVPASAVGQPAERAADRAPTTHTFSMLGLRATLPAGWRRCGATSLQHATTCHSDRWQADAWGFFEIEPWPAGIGGNCLQPQFTDGAPGHRVRVPATVRERWHKRGWRKAYANRSLIPIGDPANSPTATLFLLCARTRDGRVITMAFYRSPGHAAGSALGALWKAARTVHIKSKKVYFPGAQRHVRPHRAFWSGDGTTYLAKLHWSKWASRVARGRGLYRVNDCDPSCADGHYTSYPVRLRAYAPFYLRCAMFFRRVDVSFTVRRPAGSRKHFTMKVDRADDAQLLYDFGSCPY